MLPGDVAYQLQVAGTVLLVTERAEDELARGIVDGAHEREPGTTALEPVVVAAIDLDEHTFAEHALATAAVPWCAPLPGAGHACSTEDAPDAGPAEREALPLGEQLGQVAVVGAAVVVADGQLDDLLPGVLVDAAGAGPAAVPVGQCRGALGEEPDPQAPGVPDRDAEPRGGLLDGQVATHQVGQDATPSLFFPAQADRVSPHGRLTKSLISQH
jgi:hypothetical protein